MFRGVECFSARPRSGGLEHSGDSLGPYGLSSLLPTVLAEEKDKVALMAQVILARVVKEFISELKPVKLVTS